MQATAARSRWLTSRPGGTRHELWPYMCIAVWPWDALMLLEGATCVYSCSLQCHCVCRSHRTFHSAQRAGSSSWLLFVLERLLNLVRVRPQWPGLYRFMFQCLAFAQQSKTLAKSPEEPKPHQKDYASNSNL